jgi:small basic protein (TIGR04137 family)
MIRVNSSTVRQRSRRLRADVIYLKNSGRGLMCRLRSAREEFMSQHRSLKGASTIAAKRNVLKRFERVELLKKRGQWKEGSKVVGLPKTKPDV